MTLLKNPIFDFHKVISALTTPLTIPTLTPSLVKTSLQGVSESSLLLQRPILPHTPTGSNPEVNIKFIDQFAAVFFITDSSLNVCRLENYFTHLICMTLHFLSMKRAFGLLPPPPPPHLDGILAEADPDRQIRGGGPPDSEIKGGRSPKNFFCPSGLILVEK